MTRQVTIYDIAAAAEVSASTVSRALRKEPTIARETRKRILAMAEELGYRYNPFASSLRTCRTKNIGVVVPRLDSNYVARSVGGIEKVMSSEGYNLFLLQSLGCEHKERAAIDNMYRARVDGLIIFGIQKFSDDNSKKIFSKKQTPVIVVDSSPHGDVQSVSIDNYSAAHAVISHLYQLGCRSIAHVSPGVHSPAFSELYRGYRNALRDHQLCDSRQLTIVDERCETSPDFVQSFFSIHPFPDAIFFASDLSAALAMPVLKSRGLRIPEDICIAGFGNEPVGRIVEPQLTTVDFSPSELGQSAASSLLRIIDNPQTVIKQTIRHRLIVRRSSSGSIPREEYNRLTMTG